MLIRDIRNCEYYRALDDSILCELLHPVKESLPEMPFSIAHAIVEPGKSTKPHRLRTSVEVYYILDGEGRMFINDELAYVHQGQAIYIPPHSVQYIQNTGNIDLRILCIVHPAWRLADEEVLNI